MRSEKIMEELSKQKKMLEDLGYTVAGIFVFGSQNYGLELYTEEYQSDLDMKAIIIPTLDDLVMNSKPVSKKYTIPTGEVDVKDIRVFMEALLKGNPSYLEVLYTDYYIADSDFSVEIGEMRRRREQLTEDLKPSLMKSIYGMALEKQKALCHPYPTTKWKIDKWGYDGKQSSHCLRLYDLAWRYFVHGSSYKESLTPNRITKLELIDHKTNILPIDLVKQNCTDTVSDIKDIKDQYFRMIAENDNKFGAVKDDYLMISQEIIKNKIVDDIVNKFTTSLINTEHTEEVTNNE